MSLRTYIVTMENPGGEIARDTLTVEPALNDSTNEGGEAAAQIIVQMLRECGHVCDGDVFRITVSE